MLLRDLSSTFVNFTCGQNTLHQYSVRPETFLQLPLTFCTTRRPIVTVSQLSMQLRDHPSTSVNFPCRLVTLRLLPSTFRADGRPAINIPCGRDTLRQLPSTFRAGRGPSVNFRQISMLPVDLRSNSVNFSCSQEAFHQYFVGPQDFPSNSINFLCRRKSVNFCQLSMPLSHLLSTSVKFSYTWENFCQLPSTFLQPVDLSNSVNFLCGRETFRQF